MSINNLQIVDPRIKLKLENNLKYKINNFLDPAELSKPTVNSLKILDSQINELQTSKFNTKVAISQINNKEALKIQKKASQTLRIPLSFKSHQQQQSSEFFTRAKISTCKEWKSKRIQEPPKPELVLFEDHEIKVNEYQNNYELSSHLKYI